MLKCPICENKIEENAFTEIYTSSFNNAVAVEDLEKIKPSFQAKLLKGLKKIRFFMFLPLIALYSGKLKGNGINLYFQGEVKK